MSAGLHTPSLRRRVTLLVLAAVAVMVVVLAVVTDVVLAARLDGQQRDRLRDRAGVAAALVDQVDGRDLARRLEGEGVSVVLTETDGSVYAEGSLAGAAAGGPAQGQPAEDPVTGGPGPAGPAAEPGPRPVPGPEAEVVRAGDLLTVETRLSDGSRLELLSDTGEVRTTMRQVRLALLVGALLVLLATAVGVPLLVGRTLRPLDRITQVARTITRGDRSRRLRPTRPASELGRTAVAFDDMLDEVVGAEQRALASEERLRTFLSDTAHDLRTPLTGVQAAAELVLRDDPPREERERVLTTVVREARRASRLVDDMLLMARIDQGLAVRAEPVELVGVARAVAENRALTAAGVRIDVRGPDEGAMVVGDRDRLTRLLGNLVDNALSAARRAGTEEPVEVTVHDAGPTVVVSVRDHGPGVPAPERERIFERMVRLDQARSSAPVDAGGSGLGLPIARGIARAHGGDLVAVDPGGPGAEFRLTLPRNPAIPTSPGEATVPRAGQ